MLVAVPSCQQPASRRLQNNRIIAHYFYNPARKASRALPAAAGDGVAAPFPASTATARQKTTVGGRSPLRPWEERAGSFEGTLGPPVAPPSASREEENGGPPTSGSSGTPPGAFSAGYEDTR
jgi:hypothetical protein